MVTGLLRADLPGEDLGIEEWSEVQDNHAFAFCLLVSSHLGIGGCKKRMGLQLNGAGGTAGEGAVTALDRFGVAAKENWRGQSEASLLAKAGPLLLCPPMLI